MGDRPKADVLRDEARTLELRLEGKTFEVIAGELGYASPGAAYNCYMRGIKRKQIPNLEEMRSQEVTICDALVNANIMQALSGDQDAAKTILKAMERKARMLGLDFRDGIEARQLALNEAVAAQLMSGLEGVLTHLGITAEQRAMLPDAIEASLSQLNSSPQDV